MLEYQKNGWPHIHLIARCHYLPYPILRHAWQGQVLKGFVSIKAIKDPAHVGRELTKYIRKSFMLNSLKGTRRHAYTVSKKFLLDQKPRPADQGPAHVLTFCTSTPPHEVLSYILYALGIRGRIDLGQSSLTFKIKDTFKVSAIPALIKYFSTMPWWKKRYNISIANNYANT